MKVSFAGVVAVASLIMLGAVAYAEESAPPAKAPQPTLVPLNQNTLERLRERNKKAAEEQKAREDEKFREEQKKAKIDKIERRTGQRSKSWQVKNR